MNDVFLQAFLFPPWWWWTCHLRFQRATPILPSSGPPKQWWQHCVLAHPSPHRLDVHRCRRGTDPSQEFCNLTCMLKSANRLVMIPKPRILTLKLQRLARRKGINEIDNYYHPLAGLMRKRESKPIAPWKMLPPMKCESCFLSTTPSIGTVK